VLHVDHRFCRREPRPACPAARQAAVPGPAIRCGGAQPALIRRARACRRLGRLRHRRCSRAAPPLAARPGPPKYTSPPTPYAEKVSQRAPTRLCALDKLLTTPQRAHTLRPSPARATLPLVAASAMTNAHRIAVRHGCLCLRPHRRPQHHRKAALRAGAPPWSPSPVSGALGCFDQQTVWFHADGCASGLGACNLTVTVVPPASGSRTYRLANGASLPSYTVILGLFVPCLSMRPARSGQPPCFSLSWSLDPLARCHG
jgi:hypothetical protein